MRLSKIVLRIIVLKILEKKISTGTNDVIPTVADVAFKPNSDAYYDTPENNKIINDLIVTLKEYPELKLIIEGNAGTDKKYPNVVYGNSPEALGRGSMYSGVKSTVGKLMSGRAKAIYNALTKAGIDGNRIETKAGSASDTPEGRKTSFIFKKE